MSALAVLRAQKAILQAGKLAFRAAGIGFYIRGSAATEEASLLRFHAISLRFFFLPLFGTAVIFYHLEVSLSRTFFKIFSIVLINLCQQLL